MIKKNQIKTILFDLGGVLLETSINQKEHLKRILRSRNFDETAIDVGIHKAEQYTQDLIKSRQIISTWNEEKDYWNQYYQIIIDELFTDIPYLKDQLFHLTHYVNRCKLYNESKDVLEQLSKVYNLGIISNALPSMDFVLDQLDIRQFFKHITISAFVGFNKPDQRIFNFVLEHYHLKASECLFIDDQYRNIETAKQLGMQAIHFNKDIKNLKELFDLLL